MFPKYYPKIHSAQFMKAKIFITGILFVAVCNLFFKVAPENPKTAAARMTEASMNALIARLNEMEGALQKDDAKKLKETFLAARQQFKTTEFLTEYFFRQHSRAINGPAIPFADGEVSDQIWEPEGFQAIEEIIFPKYNKQQHQELAKLIQSLKENISAIAQPKFGYSFQERYILDAMRYEIYRIISQGISGFDSPVADNSLQETDAALKGIAEAVAWFETPIASPPIQETESLIAKARVQLQKNKHRSSFDHLSFIYNYLNPISKNLQQLLTNKGYTLPQDRRLLNVHAPSLFNMESYNPSAFSPNATSDATPEKIRLGKLLFDDRILSANNKISCSTCHQPGKAFTDGLATSIGLNGGQTKRNAPTLLNVAFNREQFYDSRTPFLEDQVFDVVHNKTEMGGSLEKTAPKLANDPQYAKLFKQAFPKANNPVNTDNIANVLACYLRSLTSFDAKFDRFMAGDQQALNTAEREGFNIFMGKAKCGTCHYVPLFNGVAPPYFEESESEVLGVPDNANKKTAKLDQDLGKYEFFFSRIPIFKHSFKTPTLRNIELTAPYMHNGVFKTLDEVIDFYNEGGGKGWKIGPENQTLSEDKLKLTKNEKVKIIAFLKTLTDTTSYKKNL